VLEIDRLNLRRSLLSLLNEFKMRVTRLYEDMYRGSRIETYSLLDPSI